MSVDKASEYAMVCAGGHMKPAKIQELSLDALLSMAHNAHHKSIWPALRAELESRLGLCGDGEWGQEPGF